MQASSTRISVVVTNQSQYGSENGWASEACCSAAECLDSYIVVSGKDKSE